MTLFAPHYLFDEMKRGGERAVVKLFRDEFPDALDLVGEKDVVKCWRKNPIDGLITTQVTPHHFNGRVLLLGDASHAMVPFYGQGMNCGLEDVRVLAILLDQYLARPAKLQESSIAPESVPLDSFADVLAAYSTVRIPATNAMQRFAQANYKEMASSVLDPFYLVRRAIDMALARVLPEGKWDSLYRMVTFKPDLAYEEVEKRRDWQSRVLRHVTEAVTFTTAVGLSTWYLTKRYSR